MRFLFRAGGCLFISSLVTFAANFSGTVVDVETGKPINGAIVTLGSKFTHTDSRGNFQIDGVATLVQARAYGYNRAQATRGSGDTKP